MMKKEDCVLRSDDISFIRILTLGCSSLVTALYCLIVEFSFKNVLDVEAIHRLFVFDESDFVAEGSEKLQYMGSAIIFTLCALFFNYLFKRLRIDYTKFKGLQYAVSAVILLVPICAVSAFCIKNLPEFSSASKNIAAILGAVVLTAFGFAVGMLGRKSRKAADVLLNLQTAGFTLLIITFNLFKKVGCEDGFNWHFDAYFSPVEKLLDGLTEGVDFHSIYGFYPYIYYIPMKLLGIFSSNRILNFSILCSILCGISYFLLCRVLKRHLKNTVVLSLTFSAMPVLMGATNYLVCLYPYYQYQPHRVIFPCIILSMISLFYSGRISNKLFYFLGTAVSGLSLFWNIDSGIVCTGGFLLAYWYKNAFYNSFIFDKSCRRQYIKTILRMIAAGIGAIAFAMLAVFIVIFIASRRVFNPVDIFFGQLTFYGYGYYMLRMPALGSWLGVVCAYVVALPVSLSAIKAFRRKDENLPFMGMLFSLSIIGVAAFSYYQGRSHDFCLLPVTWPAIMILAMLLDSLVENKENPMLIPYSMKKIGTSALGIVLSVFIFFTVLAGENFFIYQRKNFKALDYAPIAETIEANPNTQIEFLTFYETGYYEYFHMPNEKNVTAAIDCMLVTDFEKNIDFINSSDKIIAVGAQFYQRMDDFYGGHFLDKVSNSKKVINDLDSGWIFFLPTEK